MDEQRFDEILEKENLFAAWATQLLDVNRRCNWVNPVRVWEKAKACALEMPNTSFPAIKLQRLCNTIISEWSRPVANNDIWDPKHLEPQLTCACLITMVVGTEMKTKYKCFSDIETIMKCAEDESIHETLEQIIDRMRMHDIFVNYNYYAEDGRYPYEEDLMKCFLIEGNPFGDASENITTQSSVSDANQDVTSTNDDAAEINDDKTDKAMIAKLQAALDEKDKTIAKQHAALDEKDKTIAKLQAALDEKDKTITTMQEELDFYEEGHLVSDPHEKVKMEVLCRLLEYAGADFKIHGSQASGARLMNYLTDIKLQTLKNYLSQRNLNVDVHPKEVKCVNTELSRLGIRTLSK